MFYRIQTSYQTCEANISSIIKFSSCFHSKKYIVCWLENQRNLTFPLVVCSLVKTKFGLSAAVWNAGGAPGLRAHARRSAWWQAARAAGPARQRPPSPPRPAFWPGAGSCRPPLGSETSPSASSPVFHPGSSSPPVAGSLHVFSAFLCVPEVPKIVFLLEPSSEFKTSVFCAPRHLSRRCTSRCHCGLGVQTIFLLCRSAF